jgi:DNA topoisomerase-1
VHGGDGEPGILRTRHRRPRYIDDRTGKLVTDDATLERIRALAVPPAWTDVWISADGWTHVQATGRDARGRKQYRYHDDFRAHREAAKFSDLVPFGDRLGELRRRVDDDLDGGGLGRERVVALVVALLERTYIRVGNEEYAQGNKTYGLTTLRDRHVRFQRNEFTIKYNAKGSKVHVVACDDPRLCRLVRRCQDLPGQQLFQWIDDDGERRPLSSSDVNAYLRETTGLDATAKTFRTWGATVLAAAGLATVDRSGVTDGQRKQLLNEAIGMVAGLLNNTPAVCRRSYVHPVVVDRFLDGKLARRWERGPSRRAGGLEAEERRLLHVLRAR